MIKRSQVTVKQYYYYLKSQGICTGCKTRKAEKNRVKCKICLYNDRAYKKAKREIANSYKTCRMYFKGRDGFCITDCDIRNCKKNRVNK
jgi:hypothetical protein